MSVLRKCLGALVGVVAMASLVSVALPAGPAAAAEPPCRWSPFPDINCIPRPVAPPEMMRPEPTPRMTPLPGGPVSGPNETCRQAEARDDIFIREPGRPDKRVYTFVVHLEFCFDGAKVTQATVRSRTERAVPGDIRLREISVPRTDAATATGGDRYLNAQEVLFRGCGDPGNVVTCRNFRHVVQVGVTKDGVLSTSGRLEDFNGEIPV